MRGSAQKSLTYLRRLFADRTGNFAVMAGLMLPVGVILAAFAVDQGSLYTDRRDLQSLNDLAALTAAANLDRATEAAALVIQDNRSVGVSISQADLVYNPVGQDPDQIDLVVEKGRYTGKSNVAVDQRFQVGVTPFNAVRVSMRKGGDLYFGKSLMDTPLISTNSVAYVPSEAAFSVGSRLASLHGGIVNEILNQLLGTNLSLSLMDYQALANVDINALDFLGALATDLDLEAGTYNDVLDSSASVGQIATALASLSGSNQTAQLALQTLGLNALNQTVPLRQLIDLGNVGRLGIGEKPQGLNVGANVMDLLQATAALANGGHQVEVGSGLNLPGLVSISVKLAIGEPPQNSPFYAVGETGTIVRTAQTRLYISAKIGGSTQQASGGLLGLLNVKILSIEVPLYTEVAYAEARLTGISCPTGRAASIRVDIAARPGVADAYVGAIDESQLANFTSSLPVSPAKVADVTISAALGGANLSVLQVLASAHANITNNLESTLTFNKGEIDNKTIKRVSTRNPSQTLVQSLASDLNVTVNVLNSSLLAVILNPILGVVKTTVKSAMVSTLTGTLDSIVYQTLSAVGVRIGEADIKVFGATCGRPLLVQ
ncbi:MAG: hypothetical protein KDK08_25340 [Rhizobiaceae bacterium]|nr:hypothetical protein [Rhizobiaceae bacterium]